MFLIGKIMHRLMCQLINRENDREALKTILKCIQMIREDQVSGCRLPRGLHQPGRQAPPLPLRRL